MTGIKSKSDFSPYNDNNGMTGGGFGNQDYGEGFGGKTFGEDTAQDDSGSNGFGDTRQFEGDFLQGNEDEGQFSSSNTVIMGRKKEALAWLVRIENMSISKRYRLKEESTTIGRDSRCDIVMDNEEISDIHAKILQENKNYRLIDMGSLNGTYVNSKKVTSPRKLEDGDEIVFASKKFIFKKIK